MIFNLPDLGEGLAEAEIREWYVKIGDIVKEDQPLVSMETAKAVVDVPSPHAGKISKLYGKSQDIIKTGSPLVEYESNETHTDIKNKNTVVGSLEESDQLWKEENISADSNITLTPVKAFPAARALAKKLGVNLALIKASSSQGFITAEDVQQFANTRFSANDVKKESLHGTRRTMALAMAESHRTVVPVTIQEDANFSELSFESDLTVKLIQAIIHAVKKEPSLNAWFNSETLERQLFEDVNVGIAIDSNDGLFVPVIKKAQTLSADELRDYIDRLKKGVINRSISAAEMQSATITLSNFGTMAGKYANPIIVPPAVAILGVGRLRAAPIVHQNQLQIGKTLPLSFTFDHRAVTGGEAVRFLAAILEALI